MLSLSLWGDFRVQIWFHGVPQVWLQVAASILIVHSDLYLESFSKLPEHNKAQNVGSRNFSNFPRLLIFFSVACSFVVSFCFCSVLFFCSHISSLWYSHIQCLARGTNASTWKETSCTCRRSVCIYMYRFTFLRQLERQHFLFYLRNRLNFLIHDTRIASRSRFKDVHTMKW